MGTNRSKRLAIHPLLGYATPNGRLGGRQSRSQTSRNDLITPIAGPIRRAAIGSKQVGGGYPLEDAQSLMTLDGHPLEHRATLISTALHLDQFATFEMKFSFYQNPQASPDACSGHRAFQFYTDTDASHVSCRRHRSAGTRSWPSPAGSTASVSPATETADEPLPIDSRHPLRITSPRAADSTRVDTAEFSPWTPADQRQGHAQGMAHRRKPAPAATSPGRS